MRKIEGSEDNLEIQQSTGRSAAEVDGTMRAEKVDEDTIPGGGSADAYDAALTGTKVEGVGTEATWGEMGSDKAKRETKRGNLTKPEVTEKGWQEDT